MWRSEAPHLLPGCPLTVFEVGVLRVLVFEGFLVEDDDSVSQAMSTVGVLRLGVSDLLVGDDNSASHKSW